jgi:hypothetical protein
MTATDQVLELERRIRHLEKELADLRATVAETARLARHADSWHKPLAGK